MYNPDRENIIKQMVAELKQADAREDLANRIFPHLCNKEYPGGGDLPIIKAFDMADAFFRIARYNRNDVIVKFEETMREGEEKAVDAK